jgi:hypothetical protein
MNALRAPHILVWVLTSALLGACGDDTTAGTGGSAGTGDTTATGRAATTTGTTSGGGGTAGTGGDDGAYTTECGTFDPPEGGSDYVFPDDPADPTIVASCEAFCDAFGEVCENGGFFRDDCIDDCRLRACDVCPGKIEPLIRCETEEGDAAACGCQDGVPACETPEACSGEVGELLACGG